MARNLALDATDLEILRLLQNDARITHRELAKAVGLAPSTCLGRVARLRSGGIIERYIPSQAAPMRGARQQHWGVNFDYVNWLHVPVALASMEEAQPALDRLRLEGLDPTPAVEGSRGPMLRIGASLPLT